MAAIRHHQRLEQMYATSRSAVDNASVAVGYGRAELRGDAPSLDSPDVAAGIPYQQLLTDVASLAAGSIEKEHVVSAEQFQVDVVDGEYRGPLVASAQVLMAQPPRSVVQAVLRTPDGEVVARAIGVFHPTSTNLPELLSSEIGDGEHTADVSSTSADRSAPRPATFMPIYPTPFGPLCLN
jgi:hypothetical protein